MDQAVIKRLDTDSDDDRLVRAARNGDHDAFESLLRRNDPELRILATRIVGWSATDDVLQEAYLRAFRALAKFQPGRGSFKAWLCRIVYSCSIDWLRQSRRRVDPNVGTGADNREPASPTPGPHEIVVSRSHLAAVFDALPVDERVAAILVDGLGFDYASAGRIVEVAPGTLASRLHRARKRIRQALEDERYDLKEAT
jgi:RNA polymerase sigma-70 factor (ECF subfamily)